MILITGHGRSGTTFVTRLFKELGFRLLPECYKERVAPAGLEGRAQKLSTDLSARRTVYERLCGFKRDPMLAEQLQQLDADVVKVPHAQWVLTDWLDVRRDIEHVIVCLRDVNVTIERHHERTGKQREQLAQELAMYAGHTMWACALHGIDPVTVVFPKSARDAAYLYSRIGHTMDVDEQRFRHAHKRIVRGDWIHQ